MLNKITVITDPLDETSAEVFETDKNVCEALTKLYESWPAAARIYYNCVSQATEVTPKTPEDIVHLGTLTGDFYVVIYPGVQAVIVILLLVSLAVALSAKPPSTPNIAVRNSTQPSPNNELSARVNSARPNGRIPDIFGTVRSTPDLIAVPYSTFIDNVEIETATMCIGRGTYEIHDAHDGETPIEEIPGTSVEVYKPNTNIDSSTPYFIIGDPITSTPLNVKKSNSVNGQTLFAGNGKSYTGFNNISYESTGVIHITQVGGSPDMTTYFSAGDVISLQNAKKSFGSGTFGPTPDLEEDTDIAPNSPTSFVFNSVETVVPPEWAGGALINIDRAFGGADFIKTSDASVIDLTGSYTVIDAQINTVTTQPGGSTFSALEIFLDDPASVAADWALVSTNTYGAAVTHLKVYWTGYVFNLEGDNYTIDTITSDTITLVSVNSEWAKISPDPSTNFSSTITAQTDQTIGPFILGDPDGEIVIANFVAPNGIFGDNGTNQYALSVLVRVSVTPVDATGTPTGATVDHDLTLTGSAVDQSQVAATLQVSVAGRVKVSAVRVTPRDRTSPSQIVDEVKWRDLYQAQEMPTFTFPHVTIVRSQTKATTGALSVKERKLNLLVTRQIPTRISGSTFTSTLNSTNKASEILCEVIRDPYIGGRPSTEVDYDNIYDTVAALETYFGTTDATEFCYTFDKDGMTFEETVASIATGIFCTVYRQGSVIRIDPEMATDDSILLFNHRNKIPDTEIRTFNFGYEKNYDGIAYTWINPDDDAVETLELPDSTVIRPRKIESIGIRNYKQAYFHAHREYNKLRYQNMIVEFDSIAQGGLVLNGNRILVADNTRTDEQDGDIISQVGFVVGTSQKVVFESGKTYTVFLQMYDATVQSMVATEVVGNEYAFTLGTTPLLPLVVDDNSFTKTKYLIVEDTDPKRRAFLVSERTNGSGNTCKITAINYDARYYANDLDF